MQIKVITFNIHHGRGTDGRLNLNRTAEAIEESEADLIALNEVDRYFSRRSNYVDQVSWLAERLKMYYAFGAAITINSKNRTTARLYGNALLSRYPIVSENNYLMDSGLIEGRTLLEAYILLKQKPLKMYVTHLSLNPRSRRKQIDFITSKVMEEQHPVIVAGDWNIRSGGKAWWTIARVLQDCTVAANTRCPTFPSLRPIFQLDYIFASRTIQVASVDIIKKIPAASDHLPLIATLIIN